MFAAVAFLAVLLLLAIIKRLILKYRNRRSRQLFCYFEYTFDGMFGSSRDYGPLEEIDAVGAMEYRKQTGSIICFEAFRSTREEIEDLIDQREYVRHTNIARRKKWGKDNGY